MSGDGLLSEKEKQELEQQIRQGKEGKEGLTLANTRLVISIARRYFGYGLDLADLISEGNFGLMEAVEKFDPERGAKFSTYATYWIRQRIQRAIQNQGREIRLPVYVQEEIRFLRRFEINFIQTHERPPTQEEIASCLGISPERINELRNYQYQEKTRVSLQAPLGEDDDRMLEEVIPDKRNGDTAEEVATTILSEELGQLLQKLLTPRELRVIKSRFGLNGNQPKTLEEIGQEFNVTRERIRQIEAKALGKLRKSATFLQLADNL